MKNRLQTYIACLVLLLSANFAIAQNNVNILATPQSQTLNIGETATITILVEAGTQQVSGVQLIMNFDPTKIKIASPSLIPGSILTEIFLDTFDNTAGELKFIAGVQTGSSTTGTFDAVTFDVEALESTVLTEFTYDLTSILKTKISFETNQDLVGTSDPIQITVNTPPTIVIDTPADGAFLPRATDINFTATATDFEDDDTTLSIVWDVDGSFLGSGANLTAQLLDFGAHTLTATVTDSNGIETENTISIDVAEPELTIVAPTEGGVESSTTITLDLATVGMDPTSDHFHVFINPADPDNLLVSERISTSSNSGATSFTFNATNGIIEGANKIIVFIAGFSHIEVASSRQEVNFTVALPDTESPVITLLGDNPQIVTLDSTYIELGATATDAVDDDTILTTTIVIDASAVDVTAIGTYMVTYNVSDSAGNPAVELTRQVEVSPPLASENTFELAKNEIKLYPVPTKNILNIETGSLNFNTATIYSLDGKLVQTKSKTSSDNTFKINTSQLQKGVYTLKLHGAIDIHIKQFIVTQ